MREYLTDCDVLFLRREEDQKIYKEYEGTLTRDQMIRNITDQMEGARIALLKNAFPHSNVLQNLSHVRHYCLWSLDGPLSEEKIEEEVSKQFPSNKWAYMVRKPGKFSIPEIWHAHIYINS